MTVFAGYHSAGQHQLVGEGRNVIAPGSLAAISDACDSDVAGWLSSQSYQTKKVGPALFDNFAYCADDPGIPRGPKRDKRHR